MRESHSIQKSPRSNCLGVTKALSLQFTFSSDPFAAEGAAKVAYADTNANMTTTSYYAANRAMTLVNDTHYYEFAMHSH